jgi:tetratricopeptide (TPR) repeat protein
MTMKFKKKARVMIMRSIGWFWILGAGLLLGSPPPEEETLNPTSREPLFFQEARLGRLWNDYQRATQRQDDAARQEIFNEIKSLAREQQVIFEQMSLVFLNAALDERTLGQVTLAREDFINAIQLNPYLWPAYKGLADLKREEGKGRFAQWKLFIKGFFESFRPENPGFVLSLFSFVANRLGTALWWTTLLVWGVFVLMTVGLFFRSHSGALPTPLLRMLIPAGLMSGMLALGLIWPVTLGLMLVLVFPYLNTMQKMTAGLSLVFLVLIGWLGSIQVWVEQASHQLTPEVFPHRFFQGDPLRVVQELPETGLSEAEWFRKGYYYQMLGNFRDALNAYREIPRQSPFWDTAAVNTAVIFMVGRKYEEAFELMDDVQGRDVPVYWYNLSLLQSTLDKNVKAQESLNRAKAMDGEMVARWEQQGEPLFVQTMRQPSWSRFLGHYASFLTSASMLDVRILGYWCLAALLGLGFVLQQRIQNPRWVGRLCQLCGAFFFPGDTEHPDWCSQCSAINQAKLDLPSEAKLKKAEETRQHKAYKRLELLGFKFLFPSSVRFSQKQVNFEIGSLFFWVFLLLMSASSLQQIDHPSMPLMMGGDPVQWFFRVFAFGYFAWFTLRNLITRFED